MPATIAEAREAQTPKAAKVAAYEARKSSPKVAKGTPNRTTARKAAANAGRKPARKAQARTVDPAVGTGDSMRVTLTGKIMPNTAGSITDAQFARITGKFTPAQIRATAKKLGLTGSLKTASMADASDIHTTLKGA